MFDSILSPTSSPSPALLSLPHQKNQRDKLIYCELLWRLFLGSCACPHVRSSIIHLASCAATHACKILIQEAPAICCHTFHNHVVSRCDSRANPLSGQAPHACANSLSLLLLLLLPHNHLRLGTPTWFYPRHHSSVT